MEVDEKFHGSRLKKTNSVEDREALVVFCTIPGKAQQ